MRDIRFWAKIFISLVVISGFWYLTNNNFDPDLGWHLRVGESILQDKAVPTNDTLTHTMPGHTWVDHEWLTDAAVSFFYSHGLWYITVILFTLLAATPFLVWLWRTRGYIELGMIFFVSILFSFYIGIRPHLFTFFFLFIVLELLGRKKLSSLWLPFIFLLWSNFHGGFLIGLLTYGLYVAFSFHTRYFTKNILVFLVSILATLANPYGAELYREIFRVMLSGDTARYVNEWQPIFLYPQLSGSLLHAFPLWVSITSFLGVFGFLLYRYRRQYDPERLILGVIFFLGYLKSAKLGLQFFLLAMPLLIAGWRYIAADIRTARAGVPFSKKELTGFFSIRLAFWIFLFGFSYFFLVPHSINLYPAKAASVLQDLEKQGKLGNIFNEYGWGGFLEFSAPEIKVFIDGRMPHWRDAQGYSAMRDYTQVMYPRDPKNWPWRKVLADKKISTIFMENPYCAGSENGYTNKVINTLKKNRYLQNFAEKGNTSCNFKKALASDGWHIVYEDEMAIILQKGN